jgi:hypothetical protein
MRVQNESLISGATSLAADAETFAAWLGHVANLSIYIKFSGSPNGTFYVQVSNDKGNVNAQSLVNQASGVENWSTIVGSQKRITAAGSHMWDLPDVGNSWVRIIYTRNSGTGSLDIARCYTKGV